MPRKSAILRQRLGWSQSFLHTKPQVWHRVSPSLSVSLRACWNIWTIWDIRHLYRLIKIAYSLLKVLLWWPLMLHYYGRLQIPEIAVPARTKQTSQHYTCANQAQSKVVPIVPRCSEKGFEHRLAKSVKTMHKDHHRTQTNLQLVNFEQLHLFTSGKIWKRMNKKNTFCTWKNAVDLGIYQDLSLSIFLSLPSLTLLIFSLNQPRITSCNGNFPLAGSPMFALLRFTSNGFKVCKGKLCPCVCCVPQWSKGKPPLLRAGDLACCAGSIESSSTIDRIDLGGFFDCGWNMLEPQVSISGSMISMMWSHFP